MNPILIFVLLLACPCSRKAKVEPVAHADTVRVDVDKTNIVLYSHGAIIGEFWVHIDTTLTARPITRQHGNDTATASSFISVEDAESKLSRTLDTVGFCKDTTFTARIYLWRGGKRLTFKEVR